jgi:hypothetical protein
MTLSAFPTSAIKAAMVGVLARLPSLGLQRLAGALVRRVWPAFREA